jgi:putative ABC transport system permease protein
MYARLLLESLGRGTRRKLLAVTAVALGTLGATALGEVMLASGDRLASELASYGANLELVPAPGRGALAVARLPEIRRIFWRNNIVAVAPLFPLRLRLALLGRGGHRTATASAAGTMGTTAAKGDASAAGDGAAKGEVGEVVGTWFHHPLEAGWYTGLPATRPTLRVAGRWPRDDSASGAAPGGTVEAVLGRRLAARLHAAVGDSIVAALGRRAATLRVVGIVTSGGEEDDQALVPLAVIDGLAGRPGSFLRAEIFAQTNPEGRNVRDPRGMTAKEYEAWYCTAYPSSIAFQLRRALPEAEARVVSGITAATADVLGKLRGVLIALAAVALLGAAVGVTAAMTATVLERRLEAGLLVAIGAARRRVVLFFLSEAALLGGLGGLCGGALGLAAGRLMGSGALSIEVPWTPILLPFSVLLGLTVAVAASALPVSRALGRYPAALLKRATA